MYLLRHGESEFNVHFSKTRIDPGIEDPALTETGRAQAAAAAEHLRDLPIRRVVASPYRRTLQTAEIVAGRLGLAIEIEPLVRERCWFVCDVGTPTSKLRQDWPSLSFGDLPERWWPDGGENEEELGLRCSAFREKLGAETNWDDTVFVSHWAFIRGLTGMAVPNGTLLALHRGLAATIVHTSQSC
ncbi:histidine phosphatase family protein [Thalassobaculum sp. OXR-137]|uniref:histidine phosphatase family protein n=1 Tax=Thalassobaculum sp. OXR-137 TaxID=3100173 RepID=UPI002AC9AD75|nr:histidine phosphatase family protein [Thalassobaculum sp. OXR-137]WPZ35490.1 histidine phosphatase family protein [Thalassobaculum sp. OXR-137]